MTDEKEILSFRDTCDSIFAEISKDIIGQEQIVRETVTAIIAGGNVLLEGVPGLGKTRLVRTLGRVLDMPFSRIFRFISLAAARCNAFLARFSFTTLASQ
jgi:MoxR-like ATPase